MPQPLFLPDLRINQILSDTKDQDFEKFQKKKKKKKIQSKSLLSQLSNISWFKNQNDYPTFQLLLATDFHIWKDSKDVSGSSAENERRVSKGGLSGEEMASDAATTADQITHAAEETKECISQPAAN